MVAEPAVESKERAEVAGPVPAAPGFAAPQFGSAGTRSHEHAILQLQRSAGNRAVANLMGGGAALPQRAPAMVGIQRAPAMAGIQRAPAMAGVQRAPDDGAGPQLTPAARVDRLLLDAIKPGYTTFEIDFDKADEILSGMSAADGQAVIDNYRGRQSSKGWDLEKVIAGTMEYSPATANGQFLGRSSGYSNEHGPIGNNLGPKNRQRLLTLLRGTEVGFQIDPLAAAALVETSANLAGLVGFDIDRDVVATVSAHVTVAARDQNLREETDVRGRRATAQAIKIKSWIDRGQKDKVFQVLRKLASPTAAEDKKALLATFQKDAGEELFALLSRKLKGRDLEQASALYLGDITGADRAGLQGDLERYQATKSQLDKEAEVGSEGSLLAMANQAARKKLEARLRSDRDRLEARVAALKKEPMGAAAPGRTRLDDVLARDKDGDRISAELGIANEQPVTAGPQGGPANATSASDQSSGAPAPAKPTILRSSDRTVVGAVAQAELPVLLARKIRRADREGHLKATELEDAFNQLREAAVVEARKRIEANPKLQDQAVAVRYQNEVVNSFFTYFTSTFDMEDPKRPLDDVIGLTGGLADRNRNRILYEDRGDLPEWRDLEIALRYEKKDYERVKRILSGKSRSEIGTLSKEYSEHAVDGKGKPRSLRTDLLGSHEYELALRDPEKAPGRLLLVDIGKAREQYSERIAWLEGDVYEAEQPAPDPDDELEPAPEDAEPIGRVPGLPTRLTEKFGGPPVSGGDLGRNLRATTRRKDALRREAEWLFSRITGVYGRVIDNRGTFARFRDWLGNTQRQVANETRDAALTAFQQLDEALLADPPNFELATDQIGKLHLVKARMDYNIPAYKEATEAAYNAFVDFAVLAVSTLATFGNAGPVIMAIRATAATILTKATMKGEDYTADEFWSDIKGGALSAGAGKLGEKLVHRLGAAYLEKAKKLGWNQKWIGKAVDAIPKPVKDHVSGLVEGEIQAGAEAVIEGDASRLLTPLRLDSQATGIAQMTTHGAMRKGGRFIKTKQQERAAKRAEAARTQPDGGATGRRPAPTRVASPAGDMSAGEPVATDADAAGQLAGGDPTHPSLSLGTAGMGRIGDPSAKVPSADPSAAPPPGGGGSLRAVSPTLPGMGVVPGDVSGRSGPGRRGEPQGPDVPLTPDEFEVPPARMSAEELGLDPNMPNVDRARRNKEEQLRRDGQLPGPDGQVPLRPYDVTLLEQSTGPTGGRRFAAEFTPIRDGWLEAPLKVREARIEMVVNRLLEDAGMPRVRVVVDPNLAAGNAAFSPLEWTLTVSAKDVLDPSPEGFADLANAVAHETRHALHIFRGVRAGLDANPNLAVPVRGDVLERARVVNRIGGYDDPFRLPDRNDPRDRGSPAYGEAADVIQETFGLGTVDRPTAIRAGSAAAKRGEELRAALDERDKAVAARPVDQARVQRAEAQLAIARRREWEAHNAYVKTAPEADAHRAGPAAKKAVLERLQLEQRVIDTESFARRAAGELDDAILSGDAGRIRHAIATAERTQGDVATAKAALEALTPAPKPADLAAHLGAEPVVPAPAAATEVIPVPPRAARANPAPAPPAQPAPAPAQPAQPAPGLPGARLRSAKPVGGDGGGVPADAGGPAPSGGDARNELLDWAAEQAGPALDAAKQDLSGARAAREQAEKRLEDARTAGKIGGKELDVALARAKEGEAEMALGQAQNMAVRAQRVIEGIAGMGARSARSGAGSSVPQAGPPPGNGNNELLDWANQQAGPALEAANNRLTKAREAREQAEKRLADARKEGGIGGLELEVAQTRAKQGDAEMALGQAQNMAVRAQRVIEGIKRGEAAATTRAEQRNVEPIDDPDLAARLFIEQGGSGSGNLAVARQKFEKDWREAHRQERAAPAAGWRRADGTVVIDRTNPRVAAAVERLARELGPGGGSDSGSAGGLRSLPIGGGARPTDPNAPTTVASDPDSGTSALGPGAGEPRRRSGAEVLADQAVRQRATLLQAAYERTVPRGTDLTQHPYPEVSHAGTRERLQRDERFRELAWDPDHPDKGWTDKSTDEALAILHAEEAGVIPRGTTRHLVTGPDFRTARGADLDVYAPPGVSPAGDVQSLIKKLTLRNYDVLLDDRGLTRDDVDRLLRDTAAELARLRKPKELLERLISIARRSRYGSSGWR